MEQGANVKDHDWADTRGNIDRLMGLVPTGGTTGPAKGVRVTNLAWGTMTEMACHYWKSDGTDRVSLHRPALPCRGRGRFHHVRDWQERML